jgi:ketosteroid isomerase-like protein
VTTTTIAEDYVDALLSRDWDRFVAMLAPDVHREGAEGAETDSVDTREAYLGWAKNLIDPLYEYSWVVHRVAYGEGGKVAWVEATSQYRVNESDVPFGYRLAMVLEINDENLIQNVSLYWKTPQQRLPGDTISGN